MPEDDTEHRNTLRDGAKALHSSLTAKPVKANRQPSKNEDRKLGHKDEIDTSDMTPEEEVLLLHVME